MAVDFQEAPVLPAVPLTMEDYVKAVPAPACRLK